MIPGLRGSFPRLGRRYVPLMKHAKSMPCNSGLFPALFPDILSHNATVAKNLYQYDTGFYGYFPDFI
jgi:hypothetical protein